MTDTFTSVTTQVPTITAGAYAAGDAVGGRLEFKNALRVDGKRTGVILSVTGKDLASQDAPLDLVLFNQPFTATVDNSPFDPTDADLANYVNTISILSTDYSDYVDNSTYEVNNIGIGVKTVNVGQVDGEGTLYGQLVSRGTPTYVSTADLSVTLTVLQD